MLCFHGELIVFLSALFTRTCMNERTFKKENVEEIVLKSFNVLNVKVVITFTVIYQKKFNPKEMGLKI